MVKSLGLECSTLTTRPLLHQFEILINLQSYIVPYCIFVYLTDTEIAELNLVGVRKIHPTPTVAQTVFDKSLSSKKKNNDIYSHLLKNSKKGRCVINDLLIKMAPQEMFRSIF